MTENQIKINNAPFYGFMSMIICALMFVSCAPIATTQETLPTVTQTIIASETVGVSPTSEASATPGNTPTATATATPEDTATPENTATPEFTATPEAMTQAEIRAEILKAGVNLDDLANSRDEWTSSHKSIESIQNDIDNNFGREDEGFITTVVIGLEAVENLEELEQAITTDTGWKLTTFAKLAYKDINGDWQIIKVPLNAYHPEDDLFWIKNVYTGGQSFVDGEKMIKPDDDGVFKIPFERTWISSSSSQGYHSGVGSFIKLFTGWIEDPKYANNDCVLGDSPLYSEEQLIEFRKTGDSSIFGYQDSDGYYIYWPLVTFNADLSKLTSYSIEE